MLSASMDDFGREACPGRLAACRRVIDTPRAGPVRATADLRSDRQNGVRQMRHICRIAVLVSDDA